MKGYAVSFEIQLKVFRVQEIFEFQNSKKTLTWSVSIFYYLNITLNNFNSVVTFLNITLNMTLML